MKSPKKKKNKSMIFISLAVLSDAATTVATVAVAAAAVYESFGNQNEKKYAN